MSRHRGRTSRQGIGRPLRHLLADFVDAVDALAQEFLVLPAVLENVPKHSVDGDGRATTNLANVAAVKRAPLYRVGAGFSSV